MKETKERLDDRKVDWWRPMLPIKAVCNHGKVGSSGGDRGMESGAVVKGRRMDRRDFKRTVDEIEVGER